MQKAMFAVSLAGMLLAAGACVAQTDVRTASPAPDAPVGKQAGTFMVRVRAIGVLPEDSASHVTPVGGHVDATNTAAPELDLSYFLTDNFAAELIAASTRHNVSVSDSALGHVDVGSVWVLPPTVTLQYHFLPHERFSPYIGAGLNVTFFYASRPNDPPITKVGFSTGVGPAIQAGFDYNVAGHWFLNFDVKQIFVKTFARANIREDLRARQQWYHQGQHVVESDRGRRRYRLQILIACALTSLCTTPMCSPPPLAT